MSATTVEQAAVVAAGKERAGIATRIGWQPTRIHREFVALLRAEARAAAAGAQLQRVSRPRTGEPRRRAADVRAKMRAGVRNGASPVP